MENWILGYIDILSQKEIVHLYHFDTDMRFVTHCHARYLCRSQFCVIIVA